jgi:hypothetical protein
MVIKVHTAPGLPFSDSKMINPPLQNGLFGNSNRI